VRSSNAATSSAPRRSSAGPGTAERREYERELLYAEVVEHLRAITGELAITQRELAARLGVSEARVSRIMTGRENLTLKTLADLGWALGLRFEVVGVPAADRAGTPAEGDPPAPAWLGEHAKLVARRAREGSAAPARSISEHTFEQNLQGDPVSHHERPKNMHTNRTRDDDGELRRKRGDTLVGNIEREYDVDFGVRSDMRLDTLREQRGVDSLSELLEQARKQG
jgi:transcriptional regulator with XRE-family HTH domain